MMGSKSDSNGKEQVKTWCGLYKMLLNTAKFLKLIFDPTFLKSEMLAIFW